MKKIVVALSAAIALMSGSAFAAGDAAAGKAKFGSICASCHGMNGEGMGIFPKLSGKPADKTAALLKDYKAGKTVGANTAMMAPQAASLSDADIDNLAAYIATLK
ncbi:MAG: cytochrome C [Gammaproteobacteria bacterium 28-57-27]|nr:MAG: cytochrome C [Gammaproteobacteria bacterium 28-57-27]